MQVRCFLYAKKTTLFVVSLNCGRAAPKNAIAAFAAARVTGKARGTGTPALLLGTLAQLVSPWYFDMITAFIPK